MKLLNAITIVRTLLILGPIMQVANAQTSDSLRAIVTAIAAESPRPVRLSTRRTGRIDGDRVSLDRDSVVLTFDSVSRAFATSDIDSLWTHGGSAARTVGIIAAIPCAIYGAIVGGFIGGDADSNGSPRKQAVFTILGFGAGGLVCGSIGAIVGSSFQRWHLEYARPST